MEPETKAELSGSSSVTESSLQYPDKTTDISLNETEDLISQTGLKSMVVLRYIVAVVIVMVSLPLSDYFINLFTRYTYSHKSKYSNFLSAGFLSVLIRIGTMLTACFIGLRVANISPVYLWGGLGVLAFAIPISLQSPIQDFACGLLLVAFDKVRIGETVKIGDSEGVVLDIQSFSTNLLNPGNNLITEIPNSKVWGSTIKSSTRSPGRTLDISMLISHRNDIRMVEKIVKKIITKNPSVDSIHTFGYTSQDSRGLVVNISININTNDYLGLKAILYKELQIGLQDHGIIFVDGNSPVSLKYKSNVVTPIIIDSETCTKKLGQNICNIDKRLYEK